MAQPLKYEIRDEFGNDIRGPERDKIRARVAAKKWYEENKERAKAYWKTRRERKRWHDKRYYEANKKLLYAQRKARMQSDPDYKKKCYDAIKAWRNKNIEKMRKSGRERYRRRMLKDKRGYYEKQKAWRIKNPIKQKLYQKNHLPKRRSRYAKNPQICLAHNRRWKLKNPAKVKAMHCARRALKKKCKTDNTASKFITFVHSLKSVPCYYCGKVIAGKDAHVDHVIALSRLGNHASDNLAASCAECNLKKNDSLPSDITFQPQPLLNL